MWILSLNLMSMILYKLMRSHFYRHRLFYLFRINKLRSLLRCCLCSMVSVVCMFGAHCSLCHIIFKSCLNFRSVNAAAAAASVTYQTFIHDSLWINLHSELCYLCLKQREKKFKKNITKALRMKLRKCFHSLCVHSQTTAN